jgi:23S rRNA (uracil1939-C5)-methyltransferase
VKHETEKIELTIESIAYQGVSVARKDELVYFVRGGLPGDRVIASKFKKKRRYIEAKVESIIEPSKNRIDAKCKFFGVCGGCNWQNLIYEQQLFWKKQHVIDAFERIGKIKTGKFEDTLPSIHIYNYRNKMEFSFGTSRWLTEEEIMSGEEIPNKNFALGLHVPERYDKVLDIDECHIIGSEVGIDILNDIRKKAVEFDVKPWDDRLRNGFLKNLIIRTNSSSDIMVILLTNEIVNDNEFNFMKWFNERLIKEFVKIKSVIHAVNPTVSPVAVGEIKNVVEEGYLTEFINGVKFMISPFSFFQTNLRLLETFMNRILDFARLKASDIVWDLYCGTGAISLLASQKAKNVYGFELSDSSVIDAEKNAEINQITNVQFFSADLHSGDIHEIFSNIPLPDIIILDPPRAGIHKDLIDNIIALGPSRIVYVSCNPATQARDCELFSTSYEVVKVLPVDMFPQTYHVETIALLNKK